MTIEDSATMPVDFEPKLSPRFAIYLRDYLLDRNIDPAPLMAESGISRNGDELYDPAIPISKLVKLFDMAGDITHSRYVGMQMGQGYHFESSSLLILAMLAAPTVEVGIKTLFQYDKYVDTSIVTQLEIGQKLTSCITNVIDPTDSDVGQVNEYLITFLVHTLNKATRKPMPLREVWFRHNTDKSPKPLEDFFKVKLKFGQTDNKIIFDTSYLAEPFLSGSDLLFEILGNALDTYFSYGGDSCTFIDVVSREIIRGTEDESSSIEVVANQLNMSTRTLRRRISEQGHNFQSLKKLAREKRAKYYLSNTAKPLSDIALELGYSEASAFSRAFRVWTKMTPQSYRDTHQSLL